MAEFSWLTALGFAFLTFNSGMAVYRSNGDAGSVIFVAVSYLDLVALFACLRLYERLDRHSPHRDRIKAAVWALTTLLTVMFTYKVAEVMLTVMFTYKVAEVMPLAVNLQQWKARALTEERADGERRMQLEREEEESAPRAAEPPQQQTPEQAALAAYQEAFPWAAPPAFFDLTGSDDEGDA